MFAWTRNHRKQASARKSGTVTKPFRFLPNCEALEDRTTPTVSAITSNFNGTAIPAGDALWFSGSMTATGLSKTAPVTIHVENGTIDFTAGGSQFHVAVPNGVIVFTPGSTSASASFDPSDNDWDVNAPSSGAGDVFMGGVAVQLPNGLPGGIKNVTWSANFWSDTAGVSVDWKWAAAAYKTSLGGDMNGLNVKSADSKTLTPYRNGDQAGTPEAFKSLVVAGATGGGGTNYTGNFTKSTGVKVDLGDGLSDYPFASSNPRTSIAFNESEVLRGASLDVANGAFKVWYNDEHALALGVNQVIVKTASGTTVTNYQTSPLTSNPGAAVNPLVGATATTGDQAGTDVSGRPMAPSLFLTDITSDPKNRSGDWQYGGTAITPNAVFGTWKAFSKTVDYTQSATPTVTLTTSLDPVKNDWNLGAGSDAAPAGLTNQGYGAELRWNLADLQARGLLIPGHTYRFYVMVHDGDQNKSGGDAGQASFSYTYPGVAASTSLSGYVFFDGGSGTQSATLALFKLQGDGTWLQVATTTSDASTGAYSFGSILQANYKVAVVPPDATGGTYYAGTTSQAGLINGHSDGTASAQGESINGIVLGTQDAATDYDFTIHYYTLS